MRVLIAYGSKRGATAGLAVMIGDAFADAGAEVDVVRAGDVHDLSGFDAVVVAGALYANRWHRHARRFVRRHAAELRGKPVWLVSSGPLDDSAAQGEIAPVRQVAKLAARIGARGHKTFGGALDADVRGFPASALAKTHAGDWRDPVAVRAWVQGVRAQLPLSESN
ncbi:flavodoxin domain-containing protein [Mycolicibacterium palauense]|uniref:flavodoxin domain-containing protein n=1 Tax=Mycolicibacterium palauense TaxID=2034511 RepID=UPI001C3F2C93|nr:flavodoxin domain-containing protein [Mycolicibacterium palauense]